MSDAKTEAMMKLNEILARLDALTALVTAARPAPPVRASSGGGMTLPNYGKSKGLPVAGASMQDLEYYATGARRSLADPAKERWHDKERQLLAAIEAEIARQSGGDGPPPHDDADAPVEAPF